MCMSAVYIYIYNMCSIITVGAERSKEKPGLSAVIWGLRFVDWVRARVESGLRLGLGAIL